MANPTQAQTAPAAAAVETQDKGLLDQIVEQGRFGKDTTAKERGKNLVKEFVAQVLDDVAPRALRHDSEVAPDAVEVGLAPSVGVKRKDATSARRRREEAIRRLHQVRLVSRAL